MTNSGNLSDINLFKNSGTNLIQKHEISGLSGLNQYMGRVSEAAPLIKAGNSPWLFFFFFCNGSANVHADLNLAKKVLLIFY